MKEIEESNSDNPKDADSLPEDSEFCDSNSSGYNKNAITHAPEKFIGNVQLLKDKQMPHKITTLPIKSPDKKGVIHPTGGTNITRVSCNKFKVRCLIDGRAFCSSIFGAKPLDILEPHWKEKLKK
jgi:hypothetical protein